jgi:hypothetical protein
MFPRTLVVVLFLAAQTALLWWVAARDRTTQAHFAWTTVPATVPAPATAPPPQVAPPATTRPSCPPPRTDASPPGKHEIPHGVNHVTTSMTNAGWLAAWDEEKVLVSMDAGKTFTRVLDGPGSVDDVTFDCFGHAIVSRGDLLGIRDNGHETWRTVPGMGKESTDLLLIGGGPDVVAIGVGEGEDTYALTAISADLGATWWFRRLDVYWDSTYASGRQDADGTIHIALTISDCMHDPSTWFRIQPNGTVESDDLGDIGRFALFGDYAIATVWDAPKWKRFGETEWRDVKGIPTGDRVTIASGPLPRIVAGDAIYTVDRGRAKPLRPWSHEDASVDLAGHLWGIDETIDGEDAWLVSAPGTRAPIPPPQETPSNE